MLTALLRRRFRYFAIVFLFLGSLFLTSFELSRNPAVAQLFAAPPLSLTAGVQRTVLNSGLMVLTKQVRSAPVVSIQMAYDVGSVDEGDGEKGLSHQLEHMLFKGTTERPIQFGRLFSALGSDFNAFVSDDQTVYFNTVGREKLAAILTLEADRMKNAVISAEQLATEKQVVISEPQGYENSPGYQLERTVLQAAYPNRAYGLPIGGTKEDVQAFTREQV